MRKKKNKTFQFRNVHLWIAALVVLLGLAATTKFLFFFPMTAEKEHRYLYIASPNIDSVYNQLQPQVRTLPYWGFQLLCLATHYDQQIKTGKYEIGAGLTAIDLLRNLRNKHQVPVRLTIPNVRTMNHLSAKLAKVLCPDSAAFAQCFHDDSICQKYNCTVATLPALFLPNTYEVYWDITPEQLLKRMQKESEAFWTTERLQLAKEQGFTTNEIITLASIVDQETANNAEKPAIAGMYINRLRANMLLQADPTVKFALQEFGLRRILHDHLKIDSPYNTYRYKGLPPGPIALPALSSIEAVLHAEKHDYLFMCAKEDFSGTHNFARTYQEHLANARKYTKALDQRGIKK